MSSSLEGRVALVTGVSRRVGIGAAVAARLRDAGATVHACGWTPHDDEMPWGRGESAPGFDIEEVDFADPAAPARLIDRVVDRHGVLDIVVAVHARSSEQILSEVTADELDKCWAVNVRSVVLLAQRFAEVHDPAREGGRMIWFTSGQHLGPMSDTVPYTISKGALHQMTATLAVPLSRRGIVANAINPGPTDTGWADEEVHQFVAARFPSGRWGTPEDVANLVQFLVSDEGGWIHGQVIDSEGGFRRG